MAQPTEYVYISQQISEARLEKSGVTDGFTHKTNPARTQVLCELEEIESASERDEEVTCVECILRTVFPE